MLAEERYKTILGLIEKDGSVKVSNLINQFNVSVETVRRDMEFLENKKLLKRVYGGAISLVDEKELSKNYIAFKSRVTKNKEGKHKIALAAAQLVSEYDSIALDSGTTSLELAKVLKSKFNTLTILTNSLMIISELSDKERFTVISTGGILKNDEYAFVGDIAVNNIANFNINKCFISVTGISLEDGFTDWRLDEINIQKKMIEVSKEAIVLADSTKFNNTSLLKICNLDDVKSIVTEESLDSEIVRKYRSKGINVFC